MSRRINKNSITISREAIREKGGVVILPLAEWEEIKEHLDEIEERERFERAFEESRSKKGITLKGLKRRYKL